MKNCWGIEGSEKVRAEYGFQKQLKWENVFLLEILVVVVSTSRNLKMKEHLPFCREFRALSVEDRVAVNRVF